MDDLDRLKSSYHHEVMDAEDELWNSVLDRIALVEREKMKVHDKISGEFMRLTVSRRELRFAFCG